MTNAAALAVIVAFVAIGASVADPCDPTVPGMQLLDCPMTTIDGTAGMINLYLKPYTFHTYGATFVTRAYAGPNGAPSIPGPVIRIKQNKKVELTLYNMLGDQQTSEAQGAMNGLFESNTTNLHTHGLHVSGEQPADNVAVRIPPGYMYKYTYKLGPHGAGMFFYHPHAHGSVSIQLGGGAFGMLIVDDEEDNSPLGFLSTLPEILVSIYGFGPLAMETYSQNTVDGQAGKEIWQQQSGNLVNWLYIVNGLYRPTITLNAGQWYRLRLQYSAIEQPMQAKLAGCQMTLLALDGVYLNAPRTATSVRLLQASRADIAVMCPAGGPYQFIDTTGATVFAIEIGASKLKGPTALGQWNLPMRQPYLVDTMDLQPEQLANTTFAFVMTTNPDTTLSGKMFQGFNRSSALHLMLPNTVEEWTMDISAHPLHIHLSPFQLQEDTSDGNYKKGDWLDTYLGPAIKVRSRIGNFNGAVVLHCHISPHADNGVAGILWIDGMSTAAPQSPVPIPKGNRNSVPALGFLPVLIAVVACVQAFLLVA